MTWRACAVMLNMARQRSVLFSDGLTPFFHKDLQKLCCDLPVLRGSFEAENVIECS